MADPVPDDDDGATPPRGRESWLGPKGSRKRTLLLVGIALLTLLVTWLIYRANRRAAAADAGYTYPTFGSTGTTDGYASGLGELITSGFTAQQGALQSIRDALTGAPASPTGPGTTTTTSKTAARVEVHNIGTVGQTYSLRTVAARYAPSLNPDSVEAMLRRIVDANPYLKGRTTVPGGYPLRVPYKAGETAHA